ncbi:unnamed protein product [Arabidopsis lyrata]|uniref:RING-type domain-containing protein n=1 Tax=Arabidopsis lyrata subsp. lyrata TaxID=81972 RepID=D7MRN1_ARALL|nr:hypothetical protein ARALYDRAFT_918255 [Arabidopsis lyrata subsp. lyrata]CAH8279340.1 unnamed protein product [Arabidopsis lyrata]
MRVRMQSNQMEMDEAFAASLLYDDLPELSNDTVTSRQFQRPQEVVAREWQNMQDYSLISLSDDENFAKSLQEQELNRSSSHQQSHVHGSFSDDSSDSFLSPPPDVDNMSYEELNQLGESIGAVNKGLSKTRICQIPTHKFRTASSSRTNNHVSEKTQCPICIIDFKEGDTLSTLPCAHIYHEECISLWLEQNKICCVCTTELTP